MHGRSSALGLPAWRTNATLMGKGEKRDDLGGRKLYKEKQNKKKEDVEEGESKIISGDNLDQGSNCHMRRGRGGTDKKRQGDS